MTPGEHYPPCKEVNDALSDLTMAVIWRIVDQWRYDNFYALVQFNIEHWIENNPDHILNPATPAARDELFDIVSRGIIYALNIRKEQLAPLHAGYTSA